jgi:hypothetical protein
LLFQTCPLVEYWKVEQTIQGYYSGNKLTGTTHMLLKINKQPYNGNCTVDLTEGYAFLTNFTITCDDWIDDDGYIVKYEYFGT